MKTIYFPGLNGLRAIAALTVVVLHFNQFLPILFKSPELFPGNEMAELSVVLFFVLSGFLISYLLFLEKENDGTISIPKFYLKRVFRIWPPYYLVLILAVIFFPFYSQIPGNPSNSFDFKKSIVLFALVLPNLNSMFGLMLTPLRPLWSIGVEEQFYLIWPWIVKRINNIPRAIVFFIVIYFGLKLVTALLQGHFKGSATLYTFFSTAPMHIMAFGGMGAYWLRSNSKLLPLLINPLTQILCWGIYLFSFFQPIQLTFFQHELYGIIFLLIIMNVASGKRPANLLELKPLRYLGKISYGIYLYHMPIIVLLSLIISNRPLSGSMRFILLFIIIVLVISVSSLSFFYFEKRFLRLKDKMSANPQMRFAISFIKRKGE